MVKLSDPLSVPSGKTLKNRFALAPMTNSQSLADGRLGDDEYHWLVKRAEGGFGLTMTCAATVQKDGIGFPGQLAAYDEAHLDGLARLAAGLTATGSHAVVQLHHAGMRAPSHSPEAPLAVLRTIPKRALWP